MKLDEFDDPLNMHGKVRLQLQALNLTELGTVPVYDEAPDAPVKHLIATDAGVLTVLVPLVADAQPTATLTPWAEVGGARLLSAGGLETDMTITGRLENPSYVGRSNKEGSLNAAALTDFIKLCMKYEGLGAARSAAETDTST
jgi:hypothetical protein